MRKLAKSIIYMEEISPEILKELREMLYNIARKNGVKAGPLATSSEHLSNPEWIMARDFFLQNLGRRLAFTLLGRIHIEAPDLLEED